MEERRRYKRFSLDIMDIHGKMLFARNVTILDISIGGVSLIVDRRLNIGSEYALRLEWKGKIFSVKGIVVWSVLSESRKDIAGNSIPMYKAGLQFIEVDTRKVKDCINFIEEHKKESGGMEKLYGLNGHRMFLRFQIHSPEKAMLHIQDLYKVKSISLGGMLIESEHALEIKDTLPMVINFESDRSIQFSGRIVSCLLLNDKEAQIYNAGIEFIEISESDETILMEFIRQLET